MANKPRIRFRGFTEDWEQRKLDDIAKIKTGGGTPKTANPEYWSGNIPWIQSSDLVEGDIVHVNINKFINNNALKNSAAKLISRDSIALVTRVGVGKVAVINQDFTTSQDFLSLSDFDGSDIKFLAYQLYRLMQENAKVLQGTSIKGITKTELIEQSISIPSSGQEQNLISAVLSKIDSIITLHQCKLKKLNLAKKSLLQKLFPRNGSQIPGVRFKGFTDAWEQRKFSDITYLSGIKNKENKPYESYSISNEFGFIPQDEQFENGGTMKTADKSMYYIVSQNSFAYNPARINVGSIGYYDKPNNVIVSSLYEVFKTTDIVNDKFLWHWFKSNQFNRLIEKYQEGGVRLYFYYDKLCKGTIDLPTINEQNKISNLLYSLDLYITLHQRKLERLQEVKKGLLQKMFV
jgi:type I restriction enzyme S subunit